MTGLDLENSLPTTTKETTEEGHRKGAARGSSSSPPAPTLAAALLDLNGSLGFVVGSSGFILSVHHDDGDWLPYFRYGSLAWCWGCAWYLAALVPRLLRRDGRGPSEAGELLGNVLWLAGSVLGGCFGQSDVERFVPHINHLYLWGSVAFLLEPLLRAAAFAYALARGVPSPETTLRDRLARTKLFGGTGTFSPDDDDAVGCDVPRGAEDPTPLRPDADRVLELLAATFYTAAGYFGGFPPHPAHALPGVYLWEVGSLASLGRSVLLLRGWRAATRAGAGGVDEAGGTVRETVRGSSHEGFELEPANAISLQGE